MFCLLRDYAGKLDVLPTFGVKNLLFDKRKKISILTKNDNFEILYQQLNQLNAEVKMKQERIKPDLINDTFQNKGIKIKSNILLENPFKINTFPKITVDDTIKHKVIEEEIVENEYDQNYSNDDNLLEFNDTNNESELTSLNKYNEDELSSDEESICEFNSEVDSSDDNDTDEDNDTNEDKDINEHDDSLIIEVLRHNKEKVLLPDLPDLSVINFTSHSSKLENSSHNKSSMLEEGQSESDEKINDPDYINISNNNKENSDLINTLNNTTNSDKCLVNTSNRSVNIGKVEQPDYRDLEISIVEKPDKENPIPRKRRPHLCVFCNKDQINLKRHLRRKHKNEPNVQDMIKETANNPSSRHPMKNLLYAGDFKHNTNKKLFTGKFRVARRPQQEGKTVSDYAACPACMTMILEKEYRKHITVCKKITGKDCRNIVFLGRKKFRNCHPNASKKLHENILSRMRNDKILRAIRYDGLLVEYGNEICEKLRGIQHKANICTKLRRLGRLKLTLNVKNFCDIYVPGNSLKVIKALEKMATDPLKTNSDYLLYPTLAENLATLVKDVGNTYNALCLRLNNFTERDTVKQFIELFTLDYKTRLSRMIAETHGIHRRQKKVELPSSTDINILYNFLSKLRIKCYNSLQEKFDIKVYLDLLKATLSSLQVFNSRRPGDVERIYKADYENRQKIKDERRDDYELLSGGMQDLADEFSMIHTRGKWANDIKILVPPDVELCINYLLQERNKAGISPKNDYLFALPPTELHEIRHPSAYVLLTRFSETCGSVESKLLRATKIRKHLATSCMELNLTDSELTDLASYMGHHVNIHKSYYRKNVATRDIPIFLKFVRKALNSNEEDNDKCVTDSPDDMETSTVDEPEQLFNSTPNTTGEQSSNQLPKTRKKEHDASSGTHFPKNKIIKRNLNSPKEFKNVKRVKWTSEEIKVAKKYFSTFLKGKSGAPSAESIRKMIYENSKLFENRNTKSIKTWLFTNQKKV